MKTKPFNPIAKDLLVSGKYRMRVVRNRTKFFRHPKHKGANNV